MSQDRKMLEHMKKTLEKANEADKPSIQATIEIMERHIEANEAIAKLKGEI
jgi:hypothetical protein